MPSRQSRTNQRSNKAGTRPMSANRRRSVSSDMSVFDDIESHGSRAVGHTDPPSADGCEPMDGHGGVPPCPSMGLLGPGLGFKRLVDGGVREVVGVVGQGLHRHAEHDVKDLTLAVPRGQ